MREGEGAPRPRRVLIAGCGYVGTKLGTLLAARGDEVWGLRRSADQLPPSIRPISVDLLDPRLAEHLPEIDQVVYAAAADASTPQGYEAAYRQGVLNLLDALAASGTPIDRFLFLSSTAVFGEGKGGWVDEETPPAPQSFRGEIVLEGENSVLRGMRGEAQGIVLRLGGIYGPTRTRLLERVRSGEANCREGVVEWSNRIHRDDAAGAAMHLLSHPSPSTLYIGVDDLPVPLCEVYRFVARQMGIAEAGWVGKPGGAGESSGGVREPGGTESGKRCSNRRLRESGYNFLVPTFREGYAAMLREQGQSSPI